MKRLSWPALVALAALAPHREARSQAAPRPVVIRGCSVLDVAGGRMIAGRTVVLDGGKIRAVAAPGDPVETPAGATTIAAEGKFLIPGLIDAHVHLVHVLDSCRVTGDEVLPLFVAAG
jgi:imidazolonepropionase-like amidohydrolase